MPWIKTPDIFETLADLAIDPPDWGKLFRAWLFEIVDGPLSGWFNELAETIIPKAGAVAYAVWVKGQGEIGRGFGEAIDEVEKTAGPVLLEAAAAGLSDYFGQKITPEEIGLHKGFDGRRELSDRLGKLIFDSMFSTFGTARAITPESGLENAESMLGFNLSTALEGWFGGVLTTGYMSKLFPNWADLDSLMQQHLGFGRMNRRIMQPLLDELIVIPLRQHIHEIFRSEILGESQVVRALFRGAIDEDEYFDTMARHGWNRTKAAQLKVINGRLLEKEDIAKAVELGILTKEELPEIFRGLGYPPDLAEIMTTVTVEDRIRTINNALESVARDMFRDGEIIDSEYRILLADAGRSELETNRLVALGRLEQARAQSQPQKIRRVPRGTVERSFREGLITLEQLVGFYEEQRYPSGDVALMSALQQLLVIKALPPPAESPGED